MGYFIPASAGYEKNLNFSIWLSACLACCNCNVNKNFMHSHCKHGMTVFLNNFFCVQTFCKISKQASKRRIFRNHIFKFCYSTVFSLLHRYNIPPPSCDFTTFSHPFWTSFPQNQIRFLFSFRKQSARRRWRRLMRIPVVVYMYTTHIWNGLFSL